MCLHSPLLPVLNKSAMWEELHSESLERIRLETYMCAMQFVVRYRNAFHCWCSLLKLVSETSSSSENRWAVCTGSELTTSEVMFLIHASRFCGNVLWRWVKIQCEGVCWKFRAILDLFWWCTEESVNYSRALASGGWIIVDDPRAISTLGNEHKMFDSLHSVFCVTLFRLPFSFPHFLNIKNVYSGCSRTKCY